MIKTVTAIYHNHNSAEHAISALKRSGISIKDLSVLASERAVNTKIALESNSKAPEGTIAGAGLGGAIGATLAGLTATGSITLTGGLSLMAAGPVAAAFAGAGAGASLGGVAGGLIGIGIPETEAQHVDKMLSNGHVLVAVTVDKNKDVVKKVLENTKGKSVKVY